MTFCQDIYELLSKRHPNKKIYIIGDHHFYHNNIIKYTRDNFCDVNAMNDYIINAHNEVVANDDVVIFLGDFSFKKGEIFNLLSKMNGYKYLIMGNHDNADLIKHYDTLGFEGIFLNPVKIDDLYFSHEPLVTSEKDNLQFQLICQEFSKCANGYNFHGHVHEDDNYIKEKYFNATCEALDYKPLFIGRTKNIDKDIGKPLFINSPYYNELLTYLQNTYQLKPNLLSADYIYSLFLDSCAYYQNRFFIQGSYGLVKKSKFMVNFSDLDVTFLYDNSLSKKRNSLLLKTMLDDAYEKLKDIEGINLEFLKRSYQMRHLAAIYSKSGVYSKCLIDANLIFLDCYKPSDFLTLDENSMIEKLLPRKYLNLQSDYRFPRYTTNFLNPLGDIVNLTLQVIYQKGHDNKKEVALKKLYYLSKRMKDIDPVMFADMFTRFFLRNIVFFNSLSRIREIEYIQNSNLPNNLEDIYLLPNNIVNLLEVVFNSDDYPFKEVFACVKGMTKEDTLDKCQKLVRSLNKGESGARK